MQNSYREKIQPLDADAIRAAKQHWDAIAKPLHSLGRLEDMVVQLAGITGAAAIAPRKKAVFAVTAEKREAEQIRMKHSR